MASAFAKLVRATLAQRQGRPESCACGVTVYGDGGRGPVRCATCLIRRDAEPLTISFVAKFTDRRA